jgi:hypothetical protein
MKKEEDSTESERGVAFVAAAIGFVVSSALAIFAVALAENVAPWIRIIFVALAIFFAWLLFFAPSKVRVAVARWFPWF